MAPVPEVLLNVARNPFLAVGLPIGLGLAVGYTTDPQSVWAKSLQKPPGSPPDWVFGPVWTVLYGMMGYASYLASTAVDHGATFDTKALAESSLGEYYIQLGLNLLWMPTMYTAKNPLLALGNIGVLAGLVWDMTGKMSQLDTNPNTKYLLIPYALWVSYATYLNAGIVYLNWNNTTAQALGRDKRL